MLIDYARVSTEDQNLDLQRDALTRAGRERIFAALCQCRDDDRHLAEISRHVAPDAHAILNIGGAGWQKLGGALQVPENITVLHLRPYSPELNPVENI